MTLKQLAERLGVAVKDLEFELDGKCRNCKKMGGCEPACEECLVMASVSIRT